VRLTCGGHKTADADHNRSLGEHNSANVGHNDQVEQDIRSLAEEVRLNQVENRSRFKHVESQLGQQQWTLQVVADEIKGLKVDIECLIQKIGKYNTEINNLIQRVQS
jgi:ABC-type transporter Mla subunit MlaD